jgi:hypothetical protein
MMTTLDTAVQPVLDLAGRHPAFAGLIVLLAALSEAIPVVGAVMPGSAIVIGVGALVGLGQVPLWPMLAATVAGAIIGDGLSYGFGHRYKAHALAIVLTVRRSKTDQHGAGAAVAIWRSDDPDLCAPTALRRWLEHRAARHADDSLFVGLRAGGVMTAARLSDKAVVRLVKDTAEAVGDGDPGLMERTFGNLAVSVQRSYSGHSLRAGLATAAAEAELHDVMRQTRHKSVEVARRYMRSADLWRNNVTEKVMRPRT